MYRYAPYDPRARSGGPSSRPHPLPSNFPPAPLGPSRGRGSYAQPYGPSNLRPPAPSAAPRPVLNPAPLPSCPLSLSSFTTPLFPTIEALVDKHGPHSHRPPPPAIQSQPAPVPFRNVVNQSHSSSSPNFAYSGQANTGSTSKGAEVDDVAVAPGPGLPSDDFGGGFADEGLPSDRTDDLVLSPRGFPAAGPSQAAHPSPAPSQGRAPLHQPPPAPSNAPRITPPALPPDPRPPAKKLPPRPANPFLAALGGLQGVQYADDPASARASPPSHGPAGAQGSSGRSETAGGTGGKKSSANLTGGGGKTIPVIARMSSAREVMLARAGRPKKSARRNCRRYLELYEKMGKKAGASVGAWSTTAKDADYQAYIVIGGARKRKHTWHVPDSCPLALDRDADALLKTLQTADQAIILGADGFTLSSSTWLVDVLPNVKDELEFAIQTRAGKGPVFLVKAEELKQELERLERKQGVSASISADLKQWLSLMTVGQRRRKRTSAAMKDNAGELQRVEPLHLEQEKDAERVAKNQQTAHQKGSVPPANILEYVRCGRNDCIYCLTPHRVDNDHRDKDASFCWGKCLMGCNVTSGGQQGLRDHYETEHASDVGCTVAVHNDRRADAKLQRHLKLHDGKGLRSDGRSSYGWLTEEMRKTAIPYHRESSDSGWPDRTDEVPPRSMQEFLPNADFTLDGNDSSAEDDHSTDDDAAADDDDIELAVDLDGGAHGGLGGLDGALDDGLDKHDLGDLVMRSVNSSSDDSDEGDEEDDEDEEEGLFEWEDGMVFE
ncbi:hypothetical protein JCM10207_000190 [Rhodosporidiobolus poonsookiae]